VHEVAIHDGVRTDRYKLMFFQRTNEWNLFDLVTDPQEMKSVHDDPQYLSILQGLQQRYRDLREFYQVNSATIPVTRGDETWWKQRDRDKTAQGKQQAHELVFIGDSITQGWEGAGQAMWDQHFAHAPSLNLGFSGDRTEHVLWRLQRGQMGISKPRAAVIMIGTNNTGHRMQPPQETAAGVREIVALVQKQSPATKIVLLGVFPRGETAFDPMRLNNVALNQYLSRLHDGEQVFYRDLSNLFLKEDGTLPRELMPDLLHLNEAGYQIWAEALVAILRDLDVYPTTP
jgi:N-acetylglucosamine-6-sulfatase